MNNLTPMLRQYYELKQQYPGTILFFRLGDFYELFFDDAIIGARELEITLTARHKEKGNAVPMCGMPHMAAAGYIARLVRKGYRVAVCEQVEDPSKTKKLVRREVVRVITPGTAIDPQLLESRESIYLGAVCGVGESMAVAFLDLSTGEFRVTEAHGTKAWEQIKADIEAYAPKELLFPNSLAPLIKGTAHIETLPLANKREATTPNSPEENSFGTGITLTPLDEWSWQYESCASNLREHFKVKTLEGYGLEGKINAICAAGACLKYACETQKAAIAHIADITFFAPQDHLVLDAVTIKNLDLVDQPGSNHKKTLLSVLDQTSTGMGARLLRSWLLRPSIQRRELESRLSAVRYLHGLQIKRDKLRALLSEVADLERLTGRLNMGTATPRDLIALRRSLDQVPEIRKVLTGAEVSLLQVLREAADELMEVCTLISLAINDDPPANLSDGGVIREGYSQELDELRSLSSNVKQTIAALEARERSRSGIASLRVRFNGVFGYFIEVSKGSASRVPSDYERKQTLANAERFTTPELKELETRVLGAEERMLELETSIFNEIRSTASAETKRIQGTARALATLDALASLAEVAVRNRYTCPVLHDGDELEIIQGRHPIIEANESGSFIPNSIYLNNSTDRLLIITGPNMNGKSTCLRQTALICVMAQMGSFVPADSARLPILDRIWTRVGASDDLSRGRSTFMVEMIETAAILHNATPRSLILLDEIGRGTATFDGLSIAWAVAEYLHDSAEHAAKTLFATHYHELTELAERLPGAQNYKMAVAEREGEVIFLYKLEKGRASKSYGIEVARLAGLPPTVLERAREVLTKLERYELDVFAEEVKQVNGNKDTSHDALDNAAKRRARRSLATQFTLFDTVNQNLLDELRNLKVETLTDEEARMLLLDVRKRIV
jgi:DNA mismatch repair protein MutS